MLIEKKVFEIASVSTIDSSADQLEGNSNQLQKEVSWLSTVAQL